MTRRAGGIASAALLVACGLQPTVVEQPAPIGFESAGDHEQLELEERFAASLRAENLPTWLQELTAHPHHAGSPGSRRVAESLAAKFREWGYDARIETFYALVSMPKEQRVEMLAPKRHVASLSEPEIPGHTPTDNRGSLPPFNVYSADGEVTKKAVYVNYGLPDDYAWLASQGIDVRGKVVVARYGRSFRGLKPRLAAEHGAVATILYSDPADYGSARGPVYPDGPFLPDAGYQRGSVLDVPRAAGDPLSIGRGATRPPKQWTRMDLAGRISPIPVLPLSASDIAPVLAAMTGASVPEGWRGAVPGAGRVGGNVTLRVKVAQHWKVIPLYDVVARLEGAQWPDEWVLRGNNHDAWNYGALVAGSGLVAMMEEARAIGVLAKAGRRPRRTLVYLAWDGEEQGLLGSTEWAESHADELDQKAVAYLNTGITTRGRFAAGGSGVLEKLVNDVARAVRDPNKPVSVLDRAVEFVRAEGEVADRDYLQHTGRLRLTALGLGSDFTPFLQHLGIASLDYGFEGEADSGVYHSIYDNFDFYDRFGDPGYSYGVKTAEASGRTMLRLANANVLPFDFTAVAAAVFIWLEEMRALPTAASLDWSALDGAAGVLGRSAARFTSARAQEPALGSLTEVNRCLIRSERVLAPKPGLNGRPWFRHRLYAPGLDAGYAAATMPSVREAVQRGEGKSAQDEIGSMAQLLTAYAQHVDTCSQILETGRSGLTSRAATASTHGDPS